MSNEQTHPDSEAGMRMQRDKLLARVAELEGERDRYSQLADFNLRWKNTVENDLLASESARTKYEIEAADNRKMYEDACAGSMSKLQLIQSLTSERDDATRRAESYCLRLGDAESARVEMERRVEVAIKYLEDINTLRMGVKAKLRIADICHYAGHAIANLRTPTTPSQEPAPQQYDTDSEAWSHSHPTGTAEPLDPEKYTDEEAIALSMVPTPATEGKGEKWKCIACGRPDCTGTKCAFCYNDAPLPPTPPQAAKCPLCNDTGRVPNGNGAMCSPSQDQLRPSPARRAGGEGVSIAYENIIPNIAGILDKLRKRREIEMHIVPSTRGWRVDIIETYAGPTGKWPDGEPWGVTEFGSGLADTIVKAIESAESRLRQERNHP